MAGVELDMAALSLGSWYQLGHVHNSLLTMQPVTILVYLEHYMALLFGRNQIALTNFLSRRDCWMMPRLGSERQTEVQVHHWELNPTEKYHARHTPAVLKNKWWCRPAPI